MKVRWGRRRRDIWWLWIFVVAGGLLLISWDLSSSPTRDLHPVALVSGLVLVAVGYFMMAVTG
jgi:hypothetical protein